MPPRPARATCSDCATASEPPPPRQHLPRRPDRRTTRPGPDPARGVRAGNRSRAPAHQDLPDNLACVAAGRRRFLLFPPNQLRNLYIGPLARHPAGQPVSLVGPLAPDLARPSRSPMPGAMRRSPSWRPATRSSCRPCGGTHRGAGALQRAAQLLAEAGAGGHGRAARRADGDDPVHPPAARARAPGLARRVRPRRVRVRRGWRGGHIPAPAGGVLAPLDAERASNLRARLVQCLQR